MAAMIESTAETSSIDESGMYMRMFVRSMRMSPGSRPNHESAPAQVRKPTITRIAPTRMSVRPTEDRMLGSGLVSGEGKLFPTAKLHSRGPIGQPGCWALLPR